MANEEGTHREHIERVKMFTQSGPWLRSEMCILGADGDDCCEDLRLARMNISSQKILKKKGKQ